MYVLKTTYIILNYTYIIIILYNIYIHYVPQERLLWLEISAGAEVLP